MSPPVSTTTNRKAGAQQEEGSINFLCEDKIHHYDQDVEAGKLKIALGLDDSTMLSQGGEMHSGRFSTSGSARASLQFLTGLVGNPQTFLKTADERREKRRQMTYEPTHHWWEPPLRAWVPETNREILLLLFAYNALVVLLAKYTAFCGTPDPQKVINEHVFCDDDWILLEDKALVGFAVGMFLLLAFRANQAYDRWWEGRKVWGRTREVCRDYARLVCNHIECNGRNDEADRRRAVDYLTAFAVTLKCSLRGERHIVKDLTDRQSVIGRRIKLSFQDIANIQQSSHMPLFCLDVLSNYLAKQQRASKLSDYQLGIINTTVMAVLSDTLGSCERIRNTPIPLSYVLQLRFFLVLWLVLYPLHVMAFYGWYTILLASLISYAVLGIESMASEIENPFGYDRNDLDLDKFCQGICSETQDILRRHSSADARLLFDRETIVEMNKSHKFSSAEFCASMGFTIDDRDEDVDARKDDERQRDNSNTSTTMAG